MLLGLACILAASIGLGCYATTGPVPTCPQDPTQDGCLAPIHDQQAPDGGAR